MTGPVAANPLLLQRLGAGAGHRADDLRRQAQRVEDALARWNRSTSRSHGVSSVPAVQSILAVARGVAELDSWAGRVGDAFERADRMGFDPRAMLSQVATMADEDSWLVATVVSAVQAGITSTAELHAWGASVLAEAGRSPQLSLQERDQLNRVALRALLDQDGRGTGTLLQPRDRQAITDLLAMTTHPDMASMAVQVLRVTPPGGPLMEPQLVVAVGDLANATSVAYWMPGTTHGVHSMHKELVTAKDVLEQTAELGGQNTAFVIDLYDAPDTIPDAAKPGYGNDHAREASAAVADVAGLASLARITVIGHSYGSFAAGRAAAGGVDANAVVLLASPGTGESHASDLAPLRVRDDVCAPADGVFVARAPRDPIIIPADTDEGFDRLFGSPVGPPFGQILGPVAGPVARWAGAKVSLGADPADADFGATAIEVNDVTTLPTDANFAFDHSMYLLPGTRALENVAKVVIGMAPSLPSPMDLDARVAQVDPPGPSITDGLVTRTSMGWWLGTDGTAAR